MTDELVTPRTQGRDAFRAGTPITGNPYDWNYAQTAWSEGWLAEMVASSGTTRHRFSLGVQNKRTDARRILFVWTESLAEATKLGQQRILDSERILSARYVESRDEPALFTTAAEIAEGPRA